MTDSPDPATKDRTAEFLALLGSHDRTLYAYILAQVPHWTDAQDIAQETRLRLWQQLDKFEPGTDFGAWSRTIARYAILTHREKSARSHTHLSSAFVDSVGEEVAASEGELNRRQQALQHCLQKLDDAKRRLLMLYYEGRASLHQVAERLGRSPDATRKSIYRTRLALTACIENELRREETP